MSDEQTDIRDDDEDVEAHKFVSEEPGEDDAEKMKMRMKMKTKTRRPMSPATSLEDRARDLAPSLRGAPARRQTAGRAICSPTPPRERPPGR